MNALVTGTAGFIGSTLAQRLLDRGALVVNVRNAPVPTADGYRLCGTRPGQYTVLLQHRFGTRDSQASALHWPVQTDISAI